MGRRLVPLLSPQLPCWAGRGRALCLPHCCSRPSLGLLPLPVLDPGPVLPWPHFHHRCYGVSTPLLLCWACLGMGETREGADLGEGGGGGLGEGPRWGGGSPLLLSPSCCHGCVRLGPLFPPTTVGWLYPTQALTLYWAWARSTPVLGPGPLPSPPPPCYLHPLRYLHPHCPFPPPMLLLPPLAHTNELPPTLSPVVSQSECE